MSGNIEFWNTNYVPNQGTLIPSGAGFFDYDDTRSTGGSYGSMQIHNYVDEHTIFAYNRWNDENVSDLGIGNQPTGKLDWTFAAAQQPVGANDYTVKNLFIFVNQIPEPSTVALGLGSLSALAMRRRQMIAGDI